jgi:hypothetical protein
MTFCTTLNRIRAKGHVPAASQRPKRGSRSTDIAGSHAGKGGSMNDQRAEALRLAKEHEYVDPLAFLDEQPFYEMCQQYRYCRIDAALPYEALKAFIRKQIEGDIL